MVTHFVFCYFSYEDDHHFSTTTAHKIRRGLDCAGFSTHKFETRRSAKGETGHRMQWRFCDTRIWGCEGHLGRRVHIHKTSIETARARTAKTDETYDARRIQGYEDTKRRQGWKKARSARIYGLHKDSMQDALHELTRGIGGARRRGAHRKDSVYFCKQGRHWVLESFF